MLDGGGVVAEVSDVSAPENRFERRFGELLEVYTRIETPDGTPLLFETYQLTVEHRRAPTRAREHVRAGARRDPRRARAADGAHRLDPRAPASRRPSASASGCCSARSTLRPGAASHRRRPARRPGPGAGRACRCACRPSAERAGEQARRRRCATRPRRCAAACARCARRSSASIRRTCSRPGSQRRCPTSSLGSAPKVRRRGRGRRRGRASAPRSMRCSTARARKPSATSSSTPTPARCGSRCAGPATTPCWRSPTTGVGPEPDARGGCAGRRAHGARDPRRPRGRRRRAPRRVGPGPERVPSSAWRCRSRDPCRDRR